MHERDRETALVIAANMVKDTAELPNSADRNCELIQLAGKIAALARAA